MQTHIVTSTQELKDFVHKVIGSFGTVALDCETEPFQKGNPLKSHSWQLALEGVGLYTPEAHIYLPAEILQDPAAKGLLQELIRSKVLLVHNAKFDSTVLETNGISIIGATVHDIMILAALADENQPSLALKNLAQTVLGVNPADIVKFKDIPDKPEDPAKLQEWRQTMANYCLDDCRYTHELYGRFMASICEQGLLEVYNTLEKPFVEVLRAMEKRGIAVDVEYLEKIGRKLQSEVMASQEAVYKEAGGEFNVGSTTQLRKLLYEDKGYEIPKDFRTPKGELSTDKEALEYIAKKYDSKLATLVLKYREYAKLLNTYVEGIGGKVVETLIVDKGLSPGMSTAAPSRRLEHTIHTTFWQTGTQTGRLSSSDPNLQNIGRRDDEYNIRKAFVARPGYSFIISDYSQIELRILAFISGCKGMIGTYKAGGDIHKATSDAIGCDRVTAKGINFGINYGLQPYGLARNIGITEEAAEGFINEYFNKFPEVLQFMGKCVEKVQKCGYVEDIFGRRRRFPDYAECVRMGDDQAVHHMERQATNAVIQGSAASIIKLAMIRIHDALKPIGGRILLQIHDELVCEVPEDKEEEAKTIIKTLMESAVDLGEVPLVTEPKVAKHWEK